MPDYRLSSEAQLDVRKIANWGIDTFGIMKARIYRDGLTKAFARLARHRTLGEPFGHLRPQLRRLVHGSPVIYYKLIDEKIVIERILHQSQDPLRHL